jgi:hypothetical protein
MSSFKPFGTAVQANFEKMSKGELFVVEDSTDSLWLHYLASFPEGTNPTYKERTEHDCSCCKNFIRNLGKVVSLEGGKVTTVWGAKGLEYPYDVVAASMDEFIKNSVIVSVFRTSERSYGAEATVQLMPDGSTKRWNHFHGRVANRHYTQDVGTVLGNINTTAQVFMRGLEELKASAFVDILDLISSKSLYRGDEFKESIKEFQSLQKKYKALKTNTDREIFIWTNLDNRAARFRNTVIGTLLQDLSSEVELEAAVRSFESKVAPTNYKRPTALITPRMVADAMSTIKELDLEAALQRRFAKISDVSVNNVLWVDGSIQNQMKDGIEGLLLGSTAVKAVKADKAEEITIEDFMQNVVPKTTGMELFVANQLQSNFMSLTAPMHQNSGKLFKWNNDFGWSYDGNITDSIKEKVKKAGGNVTTAKLRISLAWYNFDDLDIHVFEPNGTRIYFGNKGTKLDVDMNAGGGRTREPVENVSYTSVPDGEYRVIVNQYSQRETTDVGFTVEVENDGCIQQYSYTKAAKGEIKALTITMKKGIISKLEVGSGLTGGSISQEKWGVATEKFAKVNTLMLSPNHWDDNQVGNKHWFFVLDSCQNLEATRGIYNEFLNSGLEKHRKVFEILGDKTKCQPTDDQLSGIGVSSTRGDKLTVRVTGPKINKVYSVAI